MPDITVQRGVLTFASGDVTKTLTAGTDYTAPSANSKAFLHVTSTRFNMVTSSVSNSTPDVGSVLVDDSAITTQVVFTRSVNSSSRLPKIYWEIVEYTGPSGGAHEFVVRSRGNVSFAANENSKTSGTISGIVTDSDVLPLVTGISTSVANYNIANYLFRGVWNSSTDTVTIERRRGDLTAASASYVVIEWTGSAWSLQSVDVDAVAGTTTASINSVGDMSRAFAFPQVWGQGNFTVRDSTAQAYLSAVDTVTVTTNASFAGANLDVRLWVLHNTQTGIGAMNVQRFNGTLTAQSGTFTVTTGSVTTSESSVVELSSSASNSSTFTTSYDIVSFQLTNSTTLTGEQRNGQASTTADYRVAVVTWPTTPIITPFRPYYITG